MSFRSGANTDLTLANLAVNNLTTLTNLAVTELAVTDDVDVGGDLTVDGNVSVTNNVNIVKNLVVDGTSTLVGSITADSTLLVEGVSTLTGDVNLGGDLAVAGTSVFTGGLTAQGGLGVFANFAATYIYQNGATNLIIDNNEPGSDIVLNINQPSGGGDVVLNQNCIDSSVIVATGNLIVTNGNIAVDVGSISTAGNLNVGGTSTLTGAVTADSTLTVLGNTSLTNVAISGTVTAPNIPTMEIVYYHLTGNNSNTTQTLSLNHNTTATTNYSVFPSAYYGYTGSTGTYNPLETSANLGAIVVGPRSAGSFIFNANVSATGNNYNIYLVFLVVYNIPTSDYPSTYSA